MVSNVPCTKVRGQSPEMTDSGFVDMNRLDYPWWGRMLREAGIISLN